MPPAPRNAPFCSPSARDTKITNISTPWATPDANAKEAASIRIISIPMIAGSNGHDDHALRGRTISTLTKIPIRKVITAERGPSIARQSWAATAIAASTKLPVTCPVNVFARTKPAASPYPPTKARPRGSHLSVWLMFESTILLCHLRSLGKKEGPRRCTTRPTLEKQICQLDRVVLAAGRAFRLLCSTVSPPACIPAYRHVHE